ncbi:MAG TPA: hypothetical protein VJ508_17290, partial [Saprospiraceae bacterium]|nr:hypothetical protein [Saprospiraceae bacterium]
EVDSHYNFRSSFFRLSPSIALRVAPNAQHTHLTQWWKYRWVNIHQHYGHGINYDLKDFDYQSRQYSVQELSYQIRSDYVLRPYSASANVQLGEGFVRLNAKYEQHFTRKSRMGGTWIRGFAGWLPHQDKPKANVLFTLNGLSSYGYYATDYMYDQWLGGRNAESGFFARQVFEKDAFLKTLATNGISDEWMIGGGVRTALPLSFIHLYMDAAFYPSGITEKTELSYSGGIAFVGLKDFFEIYIPILESKNIRESLSYEVRDIWHKRISFQANFRFVNPVDLVDRLQFGY